MLDINWLILAYAGIFLAGVGVLILCISAAITLGTVRRSINCCYWVCRRYDKHCRRCIESC